MTNQGKRNENRKPARLLGRMAAGVALLVAGSGLAMGQAAVDPRVNMQVRQDGRLFDANPTLGGSRINAPLPGSPIYRGNVSAVGLARWGQSLRISSPIPSSTSFRASLGSASLYDFRRDSVSVGDLAQGGIASLPLDRPFYDPGVTVPSVGFLRGSQGYGEAVASGVSPLDMRIDYGTPYQQDLLSQIVGIQPPRPAPATSTMFKLTQPTDAPPVPETNELEKPWMRWQQPEKPTEESAEDVLSRLSPEVTSLLQSPLATPLDVALQNEPYATVGLMSAEPLPPAPPAWAGSIQEGQVRPGLLVPEVTPPAETASETAELTQPGVTITDPSILPRYDMFNDIRMALALEDQPHAPWFEDMMGAAERQRNLKNEAVETSPQEAEQYLTNLLNNPLSSFVGRGENSVNDELLKAESLMDIGHYYEAAERYEKAHVLDPANPLPLIGKGHALLAAGDYRSAAGTLLRGLGRFPDLAHVPLDLTNLLGGGEIVDIRRADLMDRLAQRERPELRFLLGYLEYHTGNRESGLENLRKAAQNPAASYFITQYPSLLTAEKQAAPAGPTDAAEPADEADTAPDEAPPAENESEKLVIPPPVSPETLRVPPPVPAGSSGGAQ